MRTGKHITNESKQTASETAKVTSNEIASEARSETASETTTYLGSSASLTRSPPLRGRLARGALSPNLSKNSIRNPSINPTKIYQKSSILGLQNRPSWGPKTDFLRVQEGSKTGSLLDPDFSPFLDPLGRLPDLSWGSLGLPLGAPGRLLAALGRSWSDLGASWKRPGGVLGAS